MERMLLLRYGEINLKGLNKHYFVDTLLANVRNALRGFDHVRLNKIQSRITVEKYRDEDEQAIIDALRKIFGIVYITKCVRTELDMDLIKDAALQVIRDLPGATFKVEATRGNKKFYLESPQIAREVGAHILRNGVPLRVDVHNPDILITVEIRDLAYIDYESVRGEAGLPLGTGGKGAVMLSGGIDSPVAAYMLARRGMKVTGIHFHSYPFTSLNAQDKVVELAGKLAGYNDGMQVVMISLTKIQQEIIRCCNETYLTVILRRFMIRCAQQWCLENGIACLITGESLGQVASQTVESITCTNAASVLPIFRPLIGMDKNEIVSIARHIDTYDISIRPYEDCCTIFVPKHPQIRPVLSKVLAEEEKIPDAQEMIDEAVRTAQVVTA
ncbi:MAG: tRNA 4-thiouridine(8) synthase ThiI [Eubacteriaceae bacterium]|nr:tRNA 4-thiouridine(8) synthase ThiI [Eubacteriaceae bacterium]